MTTSLILINIYFFYFKRAEREQDPVNNNRISKLLVPDEHNEGEMTLSQPARQLCASIDAFVYAVRADDISNGKILHSICIKCCDIVTFYIFFPRN